MKLRLRYKLHYHLLSKSPDPPSSLLILHPSCLQSASMLQDMAFVVLGLVTSSIVEISPR